MLCQDGSSTGPKMPIRKNYRELARIHRSTDAITVVGRQPDNDDLPAGRRRLAVRGGAAGGAWYHDEAIEDERRRKS